MRAGEKEGPMKGIAYGLEWKNAPVVEKAEGPNRGK
jgi:hypothetical protein